MIFLSRNTKDYMNDQLKQSLINLDRMGRQVICLNPDHPTLSVYTHMIEPKCPICGSVMPTVVKSVVNVDELAGKSNK